MAAYPVLTFPELPAIDVMLMERQNEPPLGAGESASVPSAAAIVNAVFDATGVRFRELPLTPERVLAGLNGRPILAAPPQTSPKRRLGFWSKLGATAAAAATFAAVSFPLAPEIAPIARPGPGTWSAATIERGRQLAALGACAVCHTGKDGAPYAGGLALETPFGTVMTTNITPDPKTGIGNWSYPAFERAMRAGIHRDGSQLYPAFPYTNFAKTTDADMQALYAFLMSQPAVSRANEPSKLVFPFNLRPPMAVWNLVYNRATLKPDPARSAEWNRGRYLVDGLGHCSACHSPRNAVGAVKAGTSYLAGGEAEGWDAPALTAASHSPIPWGENDFYTYLRTGHSPQHGTALGPMAPVIDELKALPDADIRAMSVYLASLTSALPEAEAAARSETLLKETASAGHLAASPAARLYEGACAACHQPGRIAPLANQGPALGLSGKIHASTPNNLVRVLLEGGHGSGQMPAFGKALDDKQIAELAIYLRSRFAPAQPAWNGVAETVGKARAALR